MTLEEIEKRLSAIEDVEAIKQVQFSYVNGLMFADWPEVMECFTDDCVLDVFVEREKVQGREIIEKIFKEIVSLKHVGDENDIVCHPIITVDGDKGKGKWIIYFNQPKDDPNMPDWVKGIYDAEYKKVNGKWKISMLKWRPVFPPGMEPPKGGPPMPDIK